MRPGWPGEGRGLRPGLGVSSVSPVPKGDAPGSGLGPAEVSVGRVTAAQTPPLAPCRPGAEAWGLGPASLCPRRGLGGAASRGQTALTADSSLS